ncbi:MAG: sulfurtransferase [Nitrospirae bacterium]|nr:sulfurtransferase [Nitrospirota bacterium]
MKRVLGIWAIIFSVMLLSTAAYAASQFQHLVDAAWLAQHGKVTVVDVRNRDAYLKGHIPGAVNIPVNDLQSKPDAILFAVPQVEKMLGEKGLTIDTDTVVYGSGKEIAFLEFWMLDYLGMEKLHVLDGGMDEWKGQIAKDETKLPPAVFKAKPKQGLYATTAYVKHALKKKDEILLDVRTPGEYTGKDVRALRGGHIPGAVNINYDENFREGSTSLKSPDELAKLYSGLDRKKEIIVYCQTGTRATNTLFVLKELGFQRVRNYDASWIEWGSNPELPAADVSYFNFVSVMKQIKKLQKEVKKN